MRSWIKVRLWLHVIHENGAVVSTTGEIKDRFIIPNNMYDKHSTKLLSKVGRNGRKKWFLVDVDEDFAIEKGLEEWKGQ